VPEAQIVETLIEEAFKLAGEMGIEIDAETGEIVELVESANAGL
jgi:hypothetical protein